MRVGERARDGRRERKLRARNREKSGSEGEI